MPNRVYLFDTTLRDGEQSPGCSMTVPEKLRLARKLVELGVDILEAGFPIASDGDFEAVDAVSREFPWAQVAALAVAWRTTVQEYNRDSPILLLLDRLRATFRGRRHASCPRAGCGRSACPVR